MKKIVVLTIALLMAAALLVSCAGDDVITTASSATTSSTSTTTSFEFTTTQPQGNQGQGYPGIATPVPSVSEAQGYEFAYFVTAVSGSLPTGRVVAATGYREQSGHTLSSTETYAIKGEGSDRVVRVEYAYEELLPIEPGETAGGVVTDSGIEYWDDISVDFTLAPTHLTMDKALFTGYTTRLSEDGSLVTLTGYIEGIKIAQFAGMDSTTFDVARVDIVCDVATGNILSYSLYATKQAGSVVTEMMSISFAFTYDVKDFAVE